MMTTTCNPEPISTQISPAEAARLANFVAEHFPEEAASADLSDPKSLTDITLELLARLWRWEK